MKKVRLSYLRWGVLIILFCFVLFASISSEFGEWYAVFIYPWVSKILSALSSLVDFSLDEWGVLSVVFLLLICPFYLRVKKSKRWLQILGCEFEMVLWVYVWFYLAWGMNYDRFNFYHRAGVKPVAYDEVQFKDFLQSFTDSLHKALGNCQQDGWIKSPDLFQAMVEVDGHIISSISNERKESISLDVSKNASLSMRVIQDEIKSMYRKVPSFYGLCVPQSYQRPKRSSFNSLYSNVGVTGFMGPFFAESHVNLELSVLEYPFTYAHELSHLLGVSSEAEANLWAYIVCTQSSSSLIRLSGYMGLLPYVRSNAFYLLQRKDFEKWESSLYSEVSALSYRVHAYWASRYNPTLGEIQSAMYEFYLKRNKIVSGQKNYAQVVGMLLSLPQFNIRLK